MKETCKTIIFFNVPNIPLLFSSFTGHRQDKTPQSFEIHIGMVVLSGFEASAVSHDLIPMPSIFRACRHLLWSELHMIFSYLTLKELVESFSCINKVCYLVISREKNACKGDNGRRVVKFCSRCDWAISSMPKLNVKSTNSRLNILDKVFSKCF